MKPTIMNIDDLPTRDWGHGEKYEAKIAFAGATMNARKLGFNVTTVPPGKRPFPFHAHRANEELFFVLEGQGSIRIADKTHKIRQGDFICLPPGAESAHQIFNDSDGTLRYLAISTMEMPEVVEYPDSGKLGVMAGEPPGRSSTEDSIRYFAPLDAAVDYWEGEE